MFGNVLEKLDEKYSKDQLRLVGLLFCLINKQVNKETR